MKLLYSVFTAFLIALAVDGLTKIWAERTLVLHNPVQIVGQFFRLTLGYNTGVAFGLFANGGVWPLVVTGLIIIILAVWLVHTLRTDEFPPVAAWPIGLILGGAIANFVDRLPDGRVTDFLDFGLGAARWPTFNLADSFIVVGVAVLLWISWMSKQLGTDQ
ncbi:MAG: hypothetical protein Fur0022_00200 [Anaerolineales bacterium]